MKGGESSKFRSLKNSCYQRNKYHLGYLWFLTCHTLVKTIICLYYYSYHKILSLQINCCYGIWKIGLPDRQVIRDTQVMKSSFNLILSIPFSELRANYFASSTLRLFFVVCDFNFSFIKFLLQLDVTILDYDILGNFLSYCFYVSCFKFVFLRECVCFCF